MTISYSEEKKKKKPKSSSIAPKVNLMEQVVKFHNKNQKAKLVGNGKIIAKFNGKCFICNKTGHLAKCCKNKAWKGNLRGGMTIEANINEVDHLADKVLEFKKKLSFLKYLWNWNSLGIKWTLPWDHKKNI